MIKFFYKIKKFFFRHAEGREQVNNSIRNRGRMEMDKKLVFSLAKSRWPSLRQFKYITKYLSRVERLLVGGCFGVIILSFFFIAFRFYQTHLETMPVVGGDYVEGVVGSIKYANPLFSSVSDIDSDIVHLVYSSLLKRGENGQQINDLAQSYNVSPDGKNYTVKVRPDAFWHNGSPVTVDDIVFTFQAIKNSQYKSPLRTSFTGVEIEKIDDQTIQFKLAEPYAAFLDLLTFGILPQELWQQIEPTAASLAELNLKPVGSGEFKFKSLVKDKSGNIRTYNLIRHENYYGGPANIQSLSFKFFGNLTEAISALNNNLISGISYLPDQSKNEVIAQDSLNFYHLALPKLSAVFFNTKANPLLADQKVRQALAYAIDKDKIVSQVMAGEARTIDGPILPGTFAYNANGKKYDYNLATSSRLFNEAGWKIVELKDEDIVKAQQDFASKDESLKNQAAAKINIGAGKWLFKNNNYLSIELTTVDNPEFSQVATLIAQSWQTVNVKVKINLVSANQIQSDVIRPRNFSALLYGEIMGADPDPYAFWHSSQIGQAGLNIADYSNKEVDKLLEDGRLSNDLKVRQEKYFRFQQILIEEEPAIFLYSPYYTYVQSKNIKGFNVTSIILPSDRFTGINQWYMKTGKKIVW